MTLQSAHEREVAERDNRPGVGSFASGQQAV